MQFKNQQINLSITGYLLLIFIGGLLRVYLIREQILLDDEWHGLYYVIDKSFGHLLTHFAVPGATCPPLNLYQYLLMITIGWNETLLRLPSILCGILALILMPDLIRKEFNVKISLLFGGLLAISPFLIFYTRVARPYSPMMLFSFYAVFSAYRWIQHRQRIFLISYLLCGFMAVYLHLFALPAVLTPPLMVIFIRMTAARPSTSVLIATALFFVLMFKILIKGLESWGYASGDYVNFVTLKGFAVLLCGSSGLPLILFLCLGLWGILCLLKERSLLGALIISLCGAYFLCLLLARPPDGDIALVAARYCIILFPFFYLCTALGLENLSKQRAKFIGPLFIIMLFFAGPWLQIYQNPNNFTNHGAFQESYQTIQWEQSYHSHGAEAHFKIHRSAIPLFYRSLASELKDSKVIEYPMMVADHFNLYYYYQHFHKKEVMAGYTSKLQTKEISGHIQGSAVIGQVLSAAKDFKFFFDNMIDLSQSLAVIQSSADYLILHRNLYNEWLPRAFQQPIIFPPVKGLIKKYQSLWGPPFYTDQNLIVFKIPKGDRH